MVLTQGQWSLPFQQCQMWVWGITWPFLRNSHFEFLRGQNKGFVWVGISVLVPRHAPLLSSFFFLLDRSVIDLPWLLSDGPALFLVPWNNLSCFPIASVPSNQRDKRVSFPFSAFEASGTSVPWSVPPHSAWPSAHCGKPGFLLYLGPHFPGSPSCGQRLIPRSLGFPSHHSIKAGNRMGPRFYPQGRGERGVLQ